MIVGLPRRLICIYQEKLTLSESDLLRLRSSSEAEGDMLHLNDTLVDVYLHRLTR